MIIMHHPVKNKTTQTKKSHLPPHEKHGNEPKPPSKALAYTTNSIQSSPIVTTPPYNPSDTKTSAPTALTPLKKYTSNLNYP